MRANILKVGLLIFIAGGLCRCGGQAGQPLTATSASTVVDQLNIILGQLPQSNSAPAMPSGTNLTLAATKPGVSALATDCETVNPVTPADADTDGIALLKTGTFNCTNQASGSSSYSRSGSYTVRDLDDNKAGVLGGLHVDFNITKFAASAADGSIDGSYVGYWDYQGDGSGGVTSASEFAGRTYQKALSVDYENDYRYTYTWNWVVTPTNPADTWSTGTQSLKGVYTVDGKIMTGEAVASAKSVTGTWKISYYSKNLTYDQPGCSKYYRSGSIFMDDMNGNLLEIRFLCTSAEFYVNGAKSDWYKP